MTRVAVRALSLLILAAPAAGQSRVELFGAASLPAREARGTFASAYTPLLVNGGPATGRGEQTLTLRGGRPAGVLAGVNWLVTRRAGVQVFVHRASHTLTGANTPNHVQLTYLTRQPPDYLEREYTYERSFEWPDTEGAVTWWRIGANGLWRMSGRRIDLTVSGGVLLSRLEGHADRASYVEFHLGGHSTIFYEEVLVRLRFADAWHVGYNAGADVALAAGRHLALTAGVRVWSSPARSAVEPEILNADQMIFEIPLARVQEHFAPPPARFSQWGSPVFTLGLRVR